MYSNSAAVSRPEISAFLEEANGAEKYYLGQKILPIFTSKARAGRYPRLKIENGRLLKAQATGRAGSGTYNEVNRKFDWDTYDCTDRGLEERVDDVVASEMADFFEVEVVTGKLVMRSVMLDYEKRVADLVMNPSTFTATASSVAYTEANIATINFARDLMEAKERLTMKAEIPNTILMSEKVFNRIRRSTLLQTFLYGSLGSGTEHRLVNADDIAKAFMVEQCLIASATVDTAADGATSSMSPVWGTSYIFVGNVAGGDFTSGGIGRTIVWGADSPGGLFVSETYRDEKRRGNMVRVRMNTAEKIISSNAGELITTQWA
jgi:hypothetical protein